MKLRHSMELDCTPAALWPWIDDPERCKQWLKGMEDVRPVSTGPRREGWKAKVFIREGGRLSEYDETILAYEPNRRFRIKMEGGCLRGGSIVVDYALVDLGGRTRLDYECDAQMSGFFRIFAPLFAIFGRMQLEAFFRKLKELAEGGSGALAT